MERARVAQHCGIVSERKLHFIISVKDYPVTRLQLQLLHN